MGIVFIPIGIAVLMASSAVSHHQKISLFGFCSGECTLPWLLQKEFTLLSMCFYASGGRAMGYIIKHTQCSAVGVSICLIFMCVQVVDVSVRYDESCKSSCESKKYQRRGTHTHKRKRALTKMIREHTLASTLGILLPSCIFPLSEHLYCPLRQPRGVSLVC